MGKECKHNPKHFKCCPITGFTFCGDCNLWHTKIIYDKAPAEFKENWKEAYRNG